MWLEFDEQSTGGRGLSDVGGRTNRRVKVITWGGSSYVLLLQTKRYNGGKYKCAIQNIYGKTYSTADSSSV